MGLYEYPCDEQSAAALFVGGQVQTGAKTSPVGVLDQYATFSEAFGTLGAGTWSLGGFLNSTSPASEAHTQILWLDFAA